MVEIISILMALEYTVVVMHFSIDGFRLHRGCDVFSSDDNVVVLCSLLVALEYSTVLGMFSP